MVIWWVFLGTFLASIAGAFIPHGIISKYMGANFIGLLGTLGIATVLEVCSEGSAPLAFEIYQHTQAFGNVFIFLMAGGCDRLYGDWIDLEKYWASGGDFLADCFGAVCGFVGRFI